MTTYEFARAAAPGVMARATVHRILARNGLARHQDQVHLRKYKQWQRETPMHCSWICSGVYLADGRESKLVSGIDDHSRYVVLATVLVVRRRVGRWPTR